MCLLNDSFVFFFHLQGALVTACADDTLHLWNLRQRRPAVLHSLKFNRERYALNPLGKKKKYTNTASPKHIMHINSAHTPQPSERGTCLYEVSARYFAQAIRDKVPKPPLKLQQLKTHKRL